MRLLAWNILHGGSRRMPEIALALLEQAADVIVISEYRSTMGGQLRALLAEHGWEHQRCTEPARGKNGMLLASRLPLLPEPPTTRPRPDPPVDGRWLHAAIDTPSPIHLIGIHAPDGHGDPTLQTAYWRYLVETACAHKDDACVVMGDFNTGRHKADEEGKSFRCTSLLGLLCTYGYTDAWRSLHPQTREYTWFSHKGGGFRIDAAYVSAPLAGRLTGARHAQELRAAGISDHAPVVIELNDRSTAPTHASPATQRHHTDRPPEKVAANTGD